VCAARHDVAAVVTRADRTGSRGRPALRPVADAARELGIDVLTPAKIGAPDAVRDLLGLAIDSIVVAAYGQILPLALIDPPRYGAVNVHASLLPRWRGASPIAHAVLAGDAETGVSIMRMEAGLDTGPVYAMARIPIEENDTTPTLTAKLAELGASELAAVLSALERGAAVATSQPETGVTYAPRLGREDGALDWTARSGVEVDRMVRALQPWPGVRAAIEGRDVQIDAGGPAEIPDGMPPGVVVGDDGESVVVAAREGGYRVDLITPPGKRTMTPAAWLRGLRTREVQR
jgi:methionyl-tRNA formyltransferase